MWLRGKKDYESYDVKTTNVVFVFTNRALNQIFAKFLKTRDPLSLCVVFPKYRNDYKKPNERS